MWRKGDFEMFVAALVICSGGLGVIIGFGIGWVVFS